MFGIGAESMSRHYFLMAPTRETVVIASACDEAIRPSARLVTTRARYDRLRTKVCAMSFTLLFTVFQKKFACCLFQWIFTFLVPFSGIFSDRTFYLHTSLGRGHGASGRTNSAFSLLYYRLIGMMEGD